MKNTVARSLVSVLLTSVMTALMTMAPSLAIAETVRGFVHRDPANGSMSLLTRTASEPFRIIPAQPSITEDLRKLKDGDYIIAGGRINSHEKSVVIEAVESVGLQELLGVWRTEQWQVFEFRDFSRLNLYKATSEIRRPVGLAKLREYSYVLAPEQGNRYSIFMTDDQSVHVGSLEVSSKNVKMTVFDPDTGRVAESLSLSPLPLQ